MNPLLRWKYGIIAVLATTIITPGFSLAPANAQYNLNQHQSVSIPAKVTFQVTYDKEKVIVSPGETIPLTLKIPNDIVDANKNILIPSGTQVVGQLQPAELDSKQGVQFAAQKLIYPSGREQSIDASSKIFTKTERISKGTDTDHILTDAAIGAGAASVLALITGNHKIEVLEPIGGAAAGALASVLLRKKSADVFVLRPQDLAITLNSSLPVSR